MTRTPIDVDQLVKAAQAGDQDAYGQLVAPHQRELRHHCYRMLGSSADAEDAVQETLVRAWRGVGRFEGRSSVRSWLYRIATNACLRIIEGRPARVLPIDFGPSADPHDHRTPPLSESVWIEPYPTPEGDYEQRESVELAFIAALQYLPPAQRAVLILRDVLGFSADETATLLDTTPTSVYSSLQRAHKTVSERVPQPSQQATLRALGDDGLRTLVDRYVHAWVNGDIGGIVDLLTSDATLSMPPVPDWFAGPDTIGEFLGKHPLVAQNRWQVLPTQANGQPALAHYLWDEPSAAFRAHSLNVLTLRGDRVEAITAFFQPAAFPAFGLPMRPDQ